jgi:hypothetical protein
MFNTRSLGTGAEASSFRLYWHPEFKALISLEPLEKALSGHRAVRASTPSAAPTTCANPGCGRPVQGRAPTAKHCTDVCARRARVRRHRAAHPDRVRKRERERRRRERNRPK